MKLINLLQKTSRVSFIGATVTGLFTGISSAGLIALTNFAIANPEKANTVAGIGFVGFCCLFLVSMAFSQRLLARLVQTVTLKLQIKLTDQILACPLKHLEELGAPKFYG
ncbi:MAG: hypothetical protein ACR9NN_06895 [Nostochopsis sp.]